MKINIAKRKGINPKKTQVMHSAVALHQLTNAQPVAKP